MRAARLSPRGDLAQQLHCDNVRKVPLICLEIKDLRHVTVL
jgi:hypothetical protein